jgi:hypothetical protein
MLLRTAAQGEIAQGAQVRSGERQLAAIIRHSTIDPRASLQTPLSLCQICTEYLQTLEFLSLKTPLRRFKKTFKTHLNQ